MPTSWGMNSSWSGWFQLRLARFNRATNPNRYIGSKTVDRKTIGSANLALAPLPWNEISAAFAAMLEIHVLPGEIVVNLVGARCTMTFEKQKTCSSSSRSRFGPT